MQIGLILLVVFHVSIPYGMASGFHSYDQEDDSPTRLRDVTGQTQHDEGETKRRRDPPSSLSVPGVEKKAKDDHEQKTDEDTVPRRSVEEGTPLLNSMDVITYANSMFDGDDVLRQKFIDDYTLDILSLGLGDSLTPHEYYEKNIERYIVDVRVPNGSIPVPPPPLYVPQDHDPIKIDQRDGDNPDDYQAMIRNLALTELGKQFFMEDYALQVLSMGLTTSVEDFFEKNKQCYGPYVLKVIPTCHRDFSILGDQVAPRHSSSGGLVHSSGRSSSQQTDDSGAWEEIVHKEDIERKGGKGNREDYRTVGEIMRSVRSENLSVSGESLDPDPNGLPPLVWGGGGVPSLRRKLPQPNPLRPGQQPPKKDKKEEEEGET